MLPRYACIRILEPALEAFLHADPARRAHPFGLAFPRGAAARLTALNAPAKDLGLHPGLSVGVARRLVPSLEVEDPDPDLTTRTLEDFEAVLGCFAPELEISDPGVVFLQAHGVQGLFQSELGFLAAIHEALEARNLIAYAGVASTRQAARWAAFFRPFVDPKHPPPPGSFQGATRATVVQAQAERAFLAPLKLSILAPSPEAREFFRDLGLETLEDLARLPRQAWIDRLGDEGERAHAAALAEDLAPFQPQPRPTPLLARLDFDEALDNLEPIHQACLHLLEKLLPPLQANDRAVQSLRITLETDDLGLDLRFLQPATPARELRPLSVLLRTKLEAQPPRRPVAALEIEVEPVTTRPVQLSLFLPAGPAPQALQQTLTRLESLVGSDRIGSPARRNDPRPAGYQQHPFRPRQRAPEGELPPAISVLRSFRPPRRIQVTTQKGRPVRIRLPENISQLRELAVRHHAGPYHLSGAWWQDQPFVRSYWDLVTQDGKVVRIFEELSREAWYLDGIHD